MIPRRLPPDLAAVALLVALWLLFFWRLFTPVTADQASLTRGDFSGQFVAFAAYQYTRLSAGEIPLWNPYNNGGLPFIADTQAAVFYPPRLATIALARLAGGWSYGVLQLEMTAHVLFYTLTLYAFVRRLTAGQRGTIAGALAAAIVGGYGGFLTGYPPLQLALLEAATWLPLALLGVHMAAQAERPFRPVWLILSGTALALSWLAGHPQTSYFLTLLLLAYLAYRLRRGERPLARFILGAVLLGATAFGLAAVQLIPGFEYLTHTARAGFGYDAKANGFPLQDVAQFLFPGVVSVFSPLYVGVAGLVLALIAVWRRVEDALFWGAVAVFALLWSFGGNSVVYPLLYNILPGLRYFRGQERAAFLVANSLAILAGLGLVRLMRWDMTGDYPAALRLRLALRRLFIVSLAFAALVAVAWIGSPTAYGAVIAPITQSTLAAGALLLLIPWLLTTADRRLPTALLLALLVFELFTVNLDADAVYDPLPPAEQLAFDPPPLLAPVLDDTTGTPFRVDGFRGLHDNFGSLYGIMDMRGISPLFLSGPFALIEPDKINPPAWELFAVRYVYTDWQELPIPSEIVTTGEDRYGAVNLHRLRDPRPFALALNGWTVAASDADAHAQVRAPGINLRRVAILDRAPALALPDTEATARVTVTAFAPEHFTVEIDTPTHTLLSLAHPDYPGWHAFVDEAPAERLRAYGGLTALAIPAGTHTVRLVYEPLTFRVGAVISLAAGSAVVLLALVLLVRAARRPNGKTDANT